MRAFVEAVAARAGVSRTAAERVSRATLQTLAEKLTNERLDSLAAVLPSELAGDLVRPPRRPAAFSAREFARRVVRRGGVGAGVAPERLIAAVFAVIRDVSSVGEFDALVEALPADFMNYLDSATARPVPLRPTG